jgi:hypothetical protein
MRSQACDARARYRVAMHALDTALRRYDQTLRAERLLATRAIEIPYNRRERVHCSRLDSWCHRNIDYAEHREDADDHGESC